MTDWTETLTKLGARVSQYDPRTNPKGAILAGLAVSAVTFGALFLADVQRHRWSKEPLHYHRVDFSKIPKNDEPRRKPLKDRFIPGKTKIPEDIDYIIIGSGPSGMVCAAALARCGKRVVVLEKHDRLGGGLHTFDKKYNFDVGLHYIGKISKYGDRIFDTLCVDKKVEWIKLGSEEDGHTYDRVVVGKGKNTKVFFNKAGQMLKDIEASLKTPKEKKAFRKFLQLQDESETVMKLVFGGRLMLNSTLGRLWYRLCSWMYPQVWNKTIAQVMAQLFDNSSAEMIFRMTGNLGDLGGDYAHTPFALLPLLIHHYNDEGGFYPKGGPNSVIAALIPAIEKTGGRCLASAEVKRIIFENDRAVGVVVEKNNSEYEIRCRSGVISSAGVRNTYLKMAPLKDLPSTTPKWFLDGMNNILTQIPPSTQHFQVFVGLNKSQKELNLPKYNTWCYPFDLDSHPLTLHSYDEQLETFHRDPINGPPLAFIGFPSAKDPDYENRHPGRSVCVIATETPLYHFQKYANLTPGARGEEYEALKKKIGMRLVDTVLELYPQLKGAIDKVEIGTPLTSMHYFGAVMGESYGLDSSLNRFFNFDFSCCLRPKQPIPGLYLAGQDTALWGFTGGMIAGIQTAEAILGYHRWPVILAKRTLIRDLKKMDGIPTDDRDLLP